MTTRKRPGLSPKGSLPNASSAKGSPAKGSRPTGLSANRSSPLPALTRHWLTVKETRAETAEAMHFSLTPEPGEEALFDYAPGQFLTFSIPLQRGREEPVDFSDKNARQHTRREPVRGPQPSENTQAYGAIERSYSLSSAPGVDDDLTFCCKRVAGGRGSNWLNDHLREGDRIEATLPAGRFTLRSGAAPLLLIAGGSGITPCLSLVKQALYQTNRSIRLLYANRNAASILYANALFELKSRFGDRFECLHWLDADRGYLAEDDVTALIGPHAPDCYICGPAPLMEMAEAVLAEQLGAEATIITERFAIADETSQRAPEETAQEEAAAGASQERATKERAVQAGTAQNEEIAPSAGPSPDRVKITLDGADHLIALATSQATERGAPPTLLAAALHAGLNAPSSCLEGHCGACMALLRAGKVTMSSTKALSKRNLARGYVLACQARAASAEDLWLDFDF